jgi:hypothetical protein
VGAVQQILDKNVTLSLDEVKAIQLAKRDVVIVCITALTMASEQTYLGASFVRNKLHDAVVRATLDAINRRLSALQTA